MGPEASAPIDDRRERYLSDDFAGIQLFFHLS